MVRTMLSLLVMRSVMSVEFLLCHVCGCPSSVSQSDVSYDQCNGICRGQIFTKYISNKTLTVTTSIATWVNLVTFENILLS